METINVGQNNYYGQPQKKGQFSKTQVSLLTKSMLIGGVGFVILCVLSGLMAWAFSFADAIYTSIWFPLTFFLGFFIISMVISLLWTKILYKGKSTGLTILVYAIYLATMSVCFGFLFAMLGWGHAKNPDEFDIQYSITYLAVAFGIVGVIFLLVSLVAKIIGIKGIVTYGKIIGITSIISLVIMFGFLITAIVVGIIGQGGSPGFQITSEVISWFLFAFIALVTFFYIIIDVKSIMGISQFTTSSQEKVPSAVIWYCGFRLLSDLANVLLLVVMLLFRLRRRV